MNSTVISLFLFTSTVHCFSIKYRDEKYMFACKNEVEKKEWMQEFSKLPKIIPPSFQTHVVNDLFKPVKFEGKLWKKGPRSPQWKIRIFRLQGDSLFFFLPEKLNSPKGVIKLKDKQRINFQVQLSKTKPNSFHLVPIEKQQMKRIWMLGADDFNSLKAWIHQLKLFILLSDEAITKYLNISL